MTEGMKSAAYVINCIPLSPINMKIPNELLFGAKPIVKHFWIFGSICHVHVSDSQRTKLNLKAKNVSVKIMMKGGRAIDAWILLLINLLSQEMLCLMKFHLIKVQIESCLSKRSLGMLSMWRLHHQRSKEIGELRFSSGWL